MGFSIEDYADRGWEGVRYKIEDHEGNRFPALYYAHNVLPDVVAGAQMIAREDRIAHGMPIAAFAPG